VISLQGAADTDNLPDRSSPSTRRIASANGSAGANNGSTLGWAAEWATIGICLVLVGVALYLARAILIPLTAATIIAVTIVPLERRAERHHVPAWLFSILVVGLLVAIIQVSTIAFFAPIVKWIERAPEIGKIIGEKLDTLGAASPIFRRLQEAFLSGNGSGLKIDMGSFIEPVVGFLTPALGQLIIFLAALFFVLIGHAQLRRSIILVFSGKEARLRAIHALNEIEEDLARYVATVSVINFVLGSITALGAYLIGLPNAVLWGVLAFVCNFVPYVGPALVVCVLFGVGLINFPSVGHALIAPAFYVALTTLEGHFITPNIVGQRFTLSPPAVFLALVFWTWLWGPVGGFLAAPILIVGLTVVSHSGSADDPELPG
jgi:predicted PurR-regulated permease PerM